MQLSKVPKRQYKIKLNVRDLNLGRKMSGFHILVKMWQKRLSLLILYLNVLKLFFRSNLKTLFLVCYNSDLGISYYIKLERIRLYYFYCYVKVLIYYVIISGYRSKNIVSILHHPLDTLTFSLYELRSDSSEYNFYQWIQAF